MLDFEIPLLPERRQIIERFANRHPRIERHLVGHVRQPSLYGHFIFYRVETEDANFPLLRTQQVQQALHRRGLARAIAPEQTVTASRPDREAQIAHGFGRAVGISKIVDLNGGNGGAHTSVSLFSLARRLFSITAMRSRTISR